MRLKIILAVLGIALALNTSAQTHANEFGFQSDNDSFLAQGSDRYYTNGLFVHYRHALTVNSDKLRNKVLGFELGQKIFNPRTGQIPDRSYIDRPFAGYLYIGANINYLYADESNLKLGLRTGVVGPSALGKQSQSVIHNTFGFYTLRGWEYQIQNNFQLNLSAEYNRLLTRTTVADVSLATNAQLGTGFTGAGAGVMLRLGNFNQLFNSVSTQSTAMRNINHTPLHRYELFFYYKPSLNFIAYDATIQGGLFNGSMQQGNEVTLTKNPLVVSNELGISYGGKRWVLGLSAIFNSREVKQMVRSHQWGSATVLYRFN
ncbi:lipid A deacylase LpxR family protein [Mucilaginibacter hurinus]|uniref:Lipid A deacylase LpxR family protein n=1 Tax=Mucilaginibacter hurinus TaxID=2201324 RepID=A0A367GTV3_9SPHI|nr:lipid A deacylase LpxR family protein [Mucilaginibacter hurinus]RCH56505.1 lipid A deacylase LpxR family protein [Mucilaginibacter hurinus]